MRDAWRNEANVVGADIHFFLLPDCMLTVNDVN